MSIGSPTRARATLLVAHESDTDAQAILAEVASQVALGNATGHLRLVIDATTPPDAALWAAEVVDGAGSIRQEPLFSHLAGLGSLAMFRYVAVCTRSADGDVAVELDARMNALREKTAHLLGDGRPRVQARIGIVGFGDEQVDPRFFSAVADVNLIVIPLDRLQDSSFAQPIQRIDAAAFRAHGAVELLSATGLWRTMEEAPVDHLRTTAGGGSDTLVRLAQSRMRLLRTPALPVASLISEDRELPLPEGHQPVPNVATKLERAELLLPVELRHEASEPPRPEREQVDAKDLALMIGREVVGAFFELPRLVWRVAGGEVGALTRRALQEAVGNESRFQVLRSEDELDVDAEAVRAQESRREIDRRVHEILTDESLASRLDPIPGEIWTSLVSETLGLIDGDPDCAPLRQEFFGDAAYVPVERGALLRGLERLPEGVRVLAGAGAVADESGAESAPVDDDAPVIDVASLEVEEEPPATPPVVPSIAPDTPIGSTIARDAHRLDLIRRAWREITGLAGDVRKGADAVYRESEPFDLTGGVLTVRLAAQRSRYTARRAADATVSTALVTAIEKHLGGAPSEVRVVIDGEESEWERAMRADALVGMLGLEQDRLRVDLNKFGVKDASPRSVITAEQVRVILAAGRGKGPKLHDALTELQRNVPDFFLPGAQPIDVLRSRMADARAVTDPSSGRLGAPSDPHAPLVTQVIDVGGEDDGLLHRLRAAIVRQRAAATKDIERLVAILREDRMSSPRVTVARSVPIGGALGVLIILFRLGISDRSVQLIQGREWTAYQLDLWFTLSTMIILALALFLSDFGKRLGGQTRAMVFGAGTLAALAYVFVSFETLRRLVSGPLRENRTFALLLGLLTIAFVVYAAFQSWASRSPLRIQGSRVLGLFVVVYILVGLIMLQSQPESWFATRSEEFARRFDITLLVLGLSLILIALSVITVVRMRESRRLDGSIDLRDWALASLADAVEMRELLALAERQWLVTLAALAQVVRRPFGVIGEAAHGSDTQTESPVLKAASVRLTLSDRGVADLEARVRQELIRPSWLRVQYERLVRAHQELLATRAGVPVGALEDRRPEVEVAVPTEQEILAGRGRGDRFEFAELIANGRLDEVRRAPIAELDIAQVYRPMLAERSAQRLDGFGGRADTVREFFEQVLLENEPRIPDGVVSTALAANEEARHMRAFMWWPEEMLGAPRHPDEAEVATFPTDLFRRGVLDGAGLVSVRVDVSGEFRYAELVGAVEVDVAAMLRAAESAGRYEGSAGL